MATSYNVSAMADEVQTLKRELEALKLQLEQERKKNSVVQSGADSSKQTTERSPHCGESAQPKRRRGDAKAAAAAQKEPRIYVQHAAVGARRGKWWLRDRQVLTCATPEDGGATLKVRETWVWSGRMVILDKIVRVEEEEDAAEEGEVAEEDKQDRKLEDDVVSEVIVVEDNPVARAASPIDIAIVSSEAQTSDAAETRGEAAIVNDAEHAVVTKAEAQEESLPSQTAAKADDEVRETSAPMLPPVESSVSDAM